MRQKFDAAFDFRGFKVITKINESEFQSLSLSFPKRGENFPDTDEFNLTMTLRSVNETCLSDSVTIPRISRKPKVLIQTDKSIYKLGDAVNFQVVILNDWLEPDHPDDLKVYFINPKGREKAFDTASFKSGILSDYFAITSSAEHGEWTIEVKVNDRKAAEKKFKVGNYTLPLYNISADVKRGCKYFEGKNSNANYVTLRGKF